jgi:hypothetical protein
MVSASAAPVRAVLVAVALHAIDDEARWRAIGIVRSKSRDRRRPHRIIPSRNAFHESALRSQCSGVSAITAELTAIQLTKRFALQNNTL